MLQQWCTEWLEAHLLLQLSKVGRLLLCVLCHLLRMHSEPLYLVRRQCFRFLPCFVLLCTVRTILGLDA